jgi:hypothetical protein
VGGRGGLGLGGVGRMLLGCGLGGLLLMRLDRLRARRVLSLPSRLSLSLGLSARRSLGLALRLQTGGGLHLPLMRRIGLRLLSARVGDGGGLTLRFGLAGDVSGGLLLSSLRQGLLARYRGGLSLCLRLNLSLMRRVRLRLLLARLG